MEVQIHCFFSIFHFQKSFGYDGEIFSKDFYHKLFCGLAIQCCIQNEFKDIDFS